jgi:hypothetical protein
LLAVGGVTFLLGAYGEAALPLVWWELPQSRLEASGVQQDKEIVLVYIGSSTCGPSNSVDMRSQITVVRQILQEEAAKRGVRVRSVGIAKDIAVKAGLAHLRKMGPFDEVLTGRGWLNVGLERYVRSVMPGAAATPQLIVTVRKLSIVEGQSGSILDETVLTRKVGLEEIRTWVDAGARIESQ